MRAAYATRSPTFTSVTPSPTASTIPAPSTPRPDGNGCGYRPVRKYTSMKLRPMASCLTRASPGPGGGSSTSTYSITSGPPTRCMRMALVLIVALMMLSLNSGRCPGLQLQLRQHQMRRRQIRCARHVMHVASAYQGVDVRLMRLRRHRIAQENHAIDQAFHQQGTDLQVAAKRAGMLALDRQAQFIDQAATGSARGRQLAALQKLQVFARQGDHVIFFLVVGNQGDACFHDGSVRLGI